MHVNRNYSSSCRIHQLCLRKSNKTHTVLRRAVLSVIRGIHQRWRAFCFCHCGSEVIEKTLCLAASITCARAQSLCGRERFFCNVQLHGNLILTKWSNLDWQPPPTTPPPSPSPLPFPTTAWVVDYFGRCWPTLRHFWCLGTGTGLAYLWKKFSAWEFSVENRQTVVVKCCLMSSDVSWHIRDKLWPMPKHGSIILYVHGNQKAC